MLKLTTKAADTYRRPYLVGETGCILLLIVVGWRTSLFYDLNHSIHLTLLTKSPESIL